ncbi:hypothetical protein M9H77_18386 [Catharanthus roseus]|uniref:Uncharacterized protein n=1 Tax=Catharanthus roseus TaxID=4058 RepID=A0ACC0B7C9_CATRO|nr:hypothetical protein M9H77_18386 [Catharanthus roseus]
MALASQDLPSAVVRTLKTNLDQNFMGDGRVDGTLPTMVRQMVARNNEWSKLKVKNSKKNEEQDLLQVVGLVSTFELGFWLNSSWWDEDLLPMNFFKGGDLGMEMDSICNRIGNSHHKS